MIGHFLNGNTTVMQKLNNMPQINLFVNSQCVRIPCVDMGPNDNQIKWTTFLTEKTIQLEHGRRVNMAVLW